MKTTLRLGNGVTITANINQKQSAALFDVFCGMIFTEGSDETTKNTEDVDFKTDSIPSFSCSSPKPVVSNSLHLSKPIIRTKDKSKTKKEFSEHVIVVAHCDICNRRFSMKFPDGANVGDKIIHGCGNEIPIETIHTATGQCPNCGETFYGIGMVNEVREYKCRKCESPIDLLETKDGTLKNYDVATI